MSENFRVEDYLDLSPENSYYNPDDESFGLDSTFSTKEAFDFPQQENNADDESFGLDSIFSTKEAFDFPPQENNADDESFGLDSIFSIFSTEEEFDNQPQENSSDDWSFGFDSIFSSEEEFDNPPQENEADDSWLVRLFQQDEEISAALENGLITFEEEEFENLNIITGNTSTPYKSTSLLNPNSTFASETNHPRTGLRSKVSRINSNWGTSLSRIPNIDDDDDDVNAFARPAQTTCLKPESASAGVRMKKCLHCGTEETPQWRKGPMGPKTLCNACGVRYSSGRLVPEYRPASSPTFVPTEHSNHHRKVVRLRRKKVYSQQQYQQQHAHSMWRGSINYPRNFSRFSTQRESSEQQYQQQHAHSMWQGSINYPRNFSRFSTQRESSQQQYEQQHAYSMWRGSINYPGNFSRFRTQRDEHQQQQQHAHSMGQGSIDGTPNSEGDDRNST